MSRRSYHFPTVMFSSRSISDRLILFMAASVGVMLLFSGGAGLTYMFVEQRNQVSQHLMAQAELLASQSAAPIRRNDPGAMPAILGGLKFIEHVHWAVVTVGGQEFARYGHVPSDIKALREKAVIASGEGDRALLHTYNDQIVVWQAIGGLERQGASGSGEIYIGASVASFNARFIGLVAVSIGLTLLVVVITLPVLVLLVRQLMRPLTDLVRIADQITHDGNRQLRVRVPDRDVSGSVDEIDRLGNSFNGMLDTLADRERELASQTFNLQKLNAETNRIREEERTRIAREIHDELGQLLTRLKFDVAWIRQHAGNVREVETRGSEMSTFLDQAVQAVRRISWDLRPGILDTMGLSAAIEWLTEDFERRTGIPCRLDTDDVPAGFPDDFSSHLFRICQELMTNVARHANASEVNVVLDFHDGASLIVEDNGVGLSVVGTEGATLGLIGISERVRQMGGRLNVLSVPEYAGTSVSVRIPLQSN